ncbi:AAA-ATPase At3g28580-like [Phragmites australis]|uniref:AAA-ATPase At3g28580-like n=1 Tax=Phragmites australis TaxID=29695 RepID=UPI002D797914|nr:AAA-ATPase At3g28580-like [Phragmites australis]
MPGPRTMKHPAPASPGMVERFAGLWSALAGVMLVWSMLRPYIPHQLFDHFAGRFLRRHARRLVGLMDPYLTVTVSEYDGERMKRGDVYEQAKAYLSHRCARRARALRAERARDSDRFVLSMADNEEVADEFCGATVWWYSVPASRRGGYYHGPPWYGGGGEVVPEDAGRTYRLIFHERHRELVVDSYLPHVCREGRAIMVANRRRKLFTNGGERYGKSMWKHVVFEHPSTFETLAMDPVKKLEIMDDLDSFRKGKEYYARIGKAWKRGYLLYGPPGTGKSTMIAAMANYLDYDIYDVELTSVVTNTDLRRMFIETRGKSIIVIEDIDCSLDLTGKRSKKPPGTTDPADIIETKAPNKIKEQPADPNASKVTLSGLLNFIDGLWSACGGERIIVFTTNHIERLDPALIRRGRMDKHIEMSYCCFEAFKFLAKNYLAIDSHPLFDDIKALLQATNITPADVAELLMPKRAADDADSCLAGLVKALEKAKEKTTAKNASHNIKEDDEIVEDE